MNQQQQRQGCQKRRSTQCFHPLVGAHQVYERAEGDLPAWVHRVPSSGTRTANHDVRDDDEDVSVALILEAEVSPVPVTRASPLPSRRMGQRLRTLRQRWLQPQRPRKQEATMRRRATTATATAGEICSDDDVHANRQVQIVIEAQESDHLDNNDCTLDDIPTRGERQRRRRYSHDRMQDAAIRAKLGMVQEVFPEADTNRVVELLLHGESLANTLVLLAEESTTTTGRDEDKDSHNKTNEEDDLSCTRSTTTTVASSTITSDDGMDIAATTTVSPILPTVRPSRLRRQSTYASGTDRDRWAIFQKMKELFPLIPNEQIESTLMAHSTFRAVTVLSELSDSTTKNENNEEQQQPRSSSLSAISTKEQQEQTTERRFASSLPPNARLGGYKNDDDYNDENNDKKGRQDQQDIIDSHSAKFLADQFTYSLDILKPQRKHEHFYDLAALVD